MTAVTSNLKPLQNLRAEMAKARNARVNVGILANKTDRYDASWNKEPKNNATIGLEHEFGVRVNVWGLSTPARSFLRVPLMTQLQPAINRVGAKVWHAIVGKNGIKMGLEALGAVSHNVVQRGFETGGYGQWRPLSWITILRKKSSAILIDTGYLRKSISWVVKLGKGATP